MAPKAVWAGQGGKGGKKLTKEKRVAKEGKMLAKGKRVAKEARKDERVAKGGKKLAKQCCRAGKAASGQQRCWAVASFLSAMLPGSRRLLGSPASPSELLRVQKLVQE